MRPSFFFFFFWAGGDAAAVSLSSVEAVEKSGRSTRVSLLMLLLSELLLLLSGGCWIEVSVTRDAIRWGTNPDESGDCSDRDATMATVAESTLILDYFLLVL